MLVNIQQYTKSCKAMYYSVLKDSSAEITKLKNQPGMGRTLNFTKFFNQRQYIIMLRCRF